MNKKLLVLLALFIVIASVSAVSAFDLNDIFGSDENKTVTIGGVDFNIPAGFEDTNSSDSDAGFDQVKKEGYNVTAKVYSKDSNVVIVGVTHFNSSSEINMDELNVNKTTIKGINGSMTYIDGSYFFKYLKNNDLILISTSGDKDTIGEFIIA